VLYCPDTCQPNSNFPCVYCDTAGCCHSAGQVGTGFECTNHAASTSCSASAPVGFGRGLGVSFLSFENNGAAESGISA
jgi:hypothetical protein